MGGWVVSINIASLLLLWRKVKIDDMGTPLKTARFIVFYVAKPLPSSKIQSLTFFGGIFGCSRGLKCCRLANMGVVVDC
jgi:hypothetical protein